MSPFLSRLVLDERLRPWRFGFALLLFFLILLIGSIPGARAEVGIVASGLLLHSVAYGGITFLLYTGSAGSAARRAAKAVLAVMIMGAIDETVQSFLPYRNGDVRDWMVDVSAALLIAGLLWALLPAAPSATVQPQA